MSVVAWRAVVGAALAVAVGVGIGGIARRTARARESVVHADPGGSEALVALKDHVEELERALASSDRRIDSMESTSHAAGEAPTAPPAPREQGAPGGPPRRRTPEELRELETQQMKRFDDLATNEPRDGAWAPAFEGAIEGAIKSSASGEGAPTIDGVSCRTSVCRVELSYGTSQAQERFLSSFETHLPPTAAMHWMNGTGSRGPTTTIDLVRPGYAVPRVED